MGKVKSRLQEAVRAVRDEIYAAIREQLADQNRTYREIAEANGLSIATVQRVAGQAGISRQVGPRPRNASDRKSETDTCYCGFKGHCFCGFKGGQ